MYLPIHAAAESLQDSIMLYQVFQKLRILLIKHLVLIRIYTAILNISVNSNVSKDLISVRQDQDRKLYIRSRDLKTLRIKWMNISQITSGCVLMI